MVKDKRARATAPDVSRIGRAMSVVAAACIAMALPAAAGANGLGPKGASWPTGGEDLGNTRNNGRVNLKPDDVENINLMWSYKFRGDPWTQPTVAWDKVFIGDNAGWIYALDAATGALVWERELNTYWDDPGPDNPTNDANDPNDPDNLFPNPKPGIAATRSALAARMSKKHGPVVYFGDQAGNPTLVDGNGDPLVPFNGSNVYMVDADNGDLILMTKIAQNDEFSKDANGLHPAQLPTPNDFTVLTGAMAITGKTLITGVAGLAEANPGCAPTSSSGCTLRGRVMAFNADTLELKWETYTVPDVEGYAGASVWQSTPAIDKKRGLVYVGTGDNYNTPYDECYEAIDQGTRDRADIEAEFLANCIGSEHEDEWARNHVDSILALDLKTGEIAWSFGTLAFDTWSLPCLGPDWLETCGPDMDFSHHPMLCRAEKGSKGVLVVGQKTGQMRGLNPGNGALLWETNANSLDEFEEGLVGGFQWGAACTRKTVIGLAANSYAQDHTTEDGEMTLGGSIVGFDVTTGAVKFETLPDTSDVVHPGLQSVAANFRGLGPIADGGPPATIGAASCAGRVCGWGTSGKFGSLLLTDIKTGETLWSRETANGSVLWGGAFVRLPGYGPMWYVGSGYPSFDTGVPSDGANPNFWAYGFAGDDDVDDDDDDDDDDDKKKSKNKGKSKGKKNDDD